MFVSLAIPQCTNGIVFIITWDTCEGRYLSVEFFGTIGAAYITPTFLWLNSSHFGHAEKLNYVEFGTWEDHVFGC